MAVSRKDSRGYALRSGECQRSDGRYSYSYTNKERKRITIYSSDLISLRKREQQIRRDLEDGLSPDRIERLTVNQVFDAYIHQKYDLKATTKTNYIYTYDHFIRETFGKRRLKDIRYSDVKRFYYSLMNEKGFKPATVDNVHTLLHPAFQMAVRDGYIRVNPASGVMGEIKKSHVWVKEKRHSLTIAEQKAFMNYLFENHDYQGWKPVITVLIGTGMRIGECLGLRWEDLDFENRTISINHNFIHRKVLGSEESLHINTPKTQAGMRTIPMIEQVYEAFLEEYEIQQITGFCTQTVDGYSGFVFTSSNGNVTLPAEVNRAIHAIVADYNKEETANAKAERREPLLLPDFSAHSLRHTFCTRLCENESNLKVIQSVMGHKDIQTTMDIYADCTEDKKKEVIKTIEGKIFIM
ncbi:MAG: site-specific integrase [Lachnospiraceae bacterium]|nr:site-specific integrase [Lachnospiraceae bacterium]